MQLGNLLGHALHILNDASVDPSSLAELRGSPYAADVAVLTDHPELEGAVNIGHSTGGGEVARYVSRAKPGRVAKAVLVSAVPPIIVKSAANPGGTRSRCSIAFARTDGEPRPVLPRCFDRPFLRLQSPGRVRKSGRHPELVAPGYDGRCQGALRLHQGLSETDQTEDLGKSDVPTLVMHGDDDQVVPIADASLLSAKLLRKGELKVYKGYPHAMLTPHSDVINPDLVAFVRKSECGVRSVAARCLSRPLETRLRRASLGACDADD